MYVNTKMDLKWYHLQLINFVILNIVSASVSPSTNPPKCMPGMKTVGYTIPAGDITIEYGNPLDIECVLTDDQYRVENASSHMIFIRNNDPLPAEMVEIVDSYRIRLHVDNPSKVQADNYDCNYIDGKNKSHPVCMNVVSVGIKPLPVTDFHCVGHNYDNLTCSWTPTRNYVNTSYNLTFTIHGIASKHFECPKYTNATDDNPKMSCFYSLSTQPQYRQSREELNFTLIEKNIWGETKIFKNFKHFEWVLSGPPENLTAIDRTPSSIHLSWAVPPSMRTFPAGCVYRVFYQCEYMEKVWQNGGVLRNGKKCNRTVFYNLTGLPFAHALCDIRVAIRSADATDESMWSQNTSITVRTLSKIPERPPETAMGSFQQLSYGGDDRDVREVYVYWKQIDDWEKNGPDFKYIVRVVEDDAIRPVKVTNAYAHIVNLSMLTSYTFHIWSSNSEGLSANKSVVFLPSQNDKIADPRTFKKEEYPGGTYELSWKPTNSSAKYITSYTIFWCSNDRERPHQCTGYLDWRTLPSDKFVHRETVDSDKIYQFAIAANSNNSSSGMLWSECTILHGKSMGKMTDVWISDRAAYSIEVSWKLDCTDQIDSVRGFVVYYCPIKSPTEVYCKGKQQKKMFKGNTSVVKGTVDNLTPYTTYMFSVAVVTVNDTYSQQSDPTTDTTFETAPSTPPLNVRTVEVTNNSMTLAWLPPHTINGVLKYYELRVDDSNNLTRIDPSNTNYTIRNLHGNRKYVITLKACTTVCSVFSPPLQVHTEKGYPLQMNVPSIRFQNDTMVTIGWNEPNPSIFGLIDRYNLRIKEKRKDGNWTTIIRNLTSDTYELFNCGNGGLYNVFYVSVCGVNIADDGEHLQGQWSNELQAYCQNPTNIKWYLITAFVIVAIGLSVYCYVKVYRRCKDMKDVQVKLPPGLVPAVTEHNLGSRNNDKRLEDHRGDSRSQQAADQELLLQKLNGDGRHLSGDSSGCSSGHESATLSIDPVVDRISNSSDSGTEQANSSYCMLGTTAHVAVTTNPSDNKESPYVTVDSSPEQLSGKGVVHPFSSSSSLSASACNVSSDLNQPSGYVQTGDGSGGLLVKTINPSYVPLSLQNDNGSVNKTSGYVVAGVKKNGYVPFNLHSKLD